MKYLPLKECGQPLALTWRHGERDSSAGKSRAWGLVLAGLLLLVAVGGRTWSAREYLVTLKGQIGALVQKPSAASFEPRHNPSVAGSEEQYRLMAEVLRAQNRLREAPIAAAIALVVVLAGLGADGPRGRRSRASDLVRGGGSKRYLASSGAFEDVARRIWELAHAFSVAAVPLLAAIFFWSAATLVVNGMAITPLVLDAALSRTIGAIVTVAAELT